MGLMISELSDTAKFPLSIEYKRLGLTAHCNECPDPLEASDSISGEQHP
jgi:hypothetical protein